MPLFSRFRDHSVFAHSAFDRPAFDSPDPAPARSAVAQGDASPVLHQGLLWKVFVPDAPKLIVSRMQDHVVETSDGHLHTLVNLHRGRGLTLLSSDDDGRTWDVTARIPNTRGSSSDIRLVEGEDRLLVVTTTKAGKVLYGTYDYDLADGGWTRDIASEVTHAGIDNTTTNPTVAMDAEGTIAVAYNVEGDDGLGLVFAWSEDGGATWEKAETDFPGVAAGSFRVLSTPDGFAVLAATAEAMTFLTYDPGTDTWSGETVNETGAVGRYASHFSTTTIGDDIYAASVDASETLSVMRYEGATGAWSEPETPAPITGKTTNVQLSAGSDGSLHLVYDDHDHPGRLVVLESEDGGETWSEEAVLQVPRWLRLEPTLLQFDDLPLVRFEAPEQFDDELLVEVQVNIPGRDGWTSLYTFVLDTEADAVHLAAHDLPAHNLSADGLAAL